MRFLKHQYLHKKTPRCHTPGGPHYTINLLKLKFNIDTYSEHCFIITIISINTINTGD